MGQALTSNPPKGKAKKLGDITSLFGDSKLVHCYVNWTSSNIIGFSHGKSCPSRNLSCCATAAINCSSSTPSPSRCAKAVAWAVFISCVAAGAIIGLFIGDRDAVSAAIGAVAGSAIGVIFQYIISIAWICSPVVGILYYEHHFLMEYVEYDKDNRNPSGVDANQWEEKLVLHIYEMTSDKNLVRYKVVMTRIREGCDSPKYHNWKIIQSNDEYAMQNYIETGISYITHDQYTKEEKALERAKKLCAEDGHVYDKLNKNCEHFATACFGLLNGRGFSFQSKRVSTRHVSQ